MYIFLISNTKYLNFSKKKFAVSKITCSMYLIVVANERQFNDILDSYIRFPDLL